jgi:ribosomal protein S19
MKRSKWKFPVVDFKLLKKLKEKNLKIKFVKIKRRSLHILPIFMKFSFSVYNGQNYFRFKNNFLTVANKLGSFSYTRKIYKKKK